MRGQLSKRELPIAGNMSDIKSISQLREQLNLYLQEILKVTIKYPSGSTAEKPLPNQSNDSSGLLLTSVPGGKINSTLMHDSNATSA